jgi:hypothetical protein
VNGDKSVRADLAVSISWKNFVNPLFVASKLTSCRPIVLSVAAAPDVGDFFVAASFIKAAYAEALNILPS